MDNEVHRLFGHKEWKISVKWKKFSIEWLQNLLFFVLEVNDKINDYEMVETNTCVGIDEEYEIEPHHLNRNF
jgi:hypothetical protein